jgi:hypothetical protein
MVPQEMTLTEDDTSLDHALAILGANGGDLPSLPIEDRLLLASSQLVRGITAPSPDNTDYLGTVWPFGGTSRNTSSMAQTTAGATKQTLTTAASVPVNGLAWYSPGYVYALAQLGTTAKPSTYLLANGPYWQDLSKVTAPANSLSLADATCTLLFDKNNYIYFNTRANPQNYNSANAVMRTSYQPSTYTYISFYVQPYYSSDYGKPVAIVLSGSALRSAYRQDNRTGNAFSVYANGTLWANSTYYGTSSTYTLPAKTINTTFGSWVSIAASGQSYAIKGNSASQSLKINIQVK